MRVVSVTVSSTVYYDTLGPRDSHPQKCSVRATETMLGLQRCPGAWPPRSIFAATNRICDHNAAALPRASPVALRSRHLGMKAGGKPARPGSNLQPRVVLHAGVPTWVLATAQVA